MRIEITQVAEAQITEAAAWWKDNRLSAPGAILEELDRILGLLVVQPELGAKAKQPGLSGVRRVLLSRIHYYVYYRVTREALQVLAFWHSSRGHGPSI